MCDAHPWGLADGLPCVGTDTPHVHVFQASDAPDKHGASEDAAERRNG